MESEPKLTAWVVDEIDGESARLVFATSADEAWSEVYGDDMACEGCPGREGCECWPSDAPLREPQLDQYAPGPVPMEAYRRAGWGWRCQECGNDAMSGEWDVVDGAGICDECMDERKRESRKQQEPSDD